MLTRREAVVLALALLLHVAAFLCVDRTHGAPDGAPSEATPFEVELEAPPVEPPPERAEDHAEEPRAASVPTAAAGRAPALDRAPHADEANVAPEPTPMAAPSGSAFTFYPGARPGLSDDALGLTGRNRFLGAVPGQDQGGATSLAEEGPRNAAPGVDQSMHDALDARDHDLGLDIGGPLVAVAEELTRPSDTPMNGRAVFEVVLDAAGNVLEVHVLDVSASRAAWERLAAQLGAALRSRRIALRTKGHGLVAHIEVTSRWALPSGQASAVSSPFGNASGEGTGGGVHFDVSDIGARPARSVHARILGEKSL
jgi:hypothetical protein